jgi:hypothetical protein
MHRAQYPAALAERILARTTVSAEGCWDYNGSLTSRGYGRISCLIDGTSKKYRTHRVVYEAYVGAIPEGLTIDHICFNPRCVNPAHLEVVTRSENTRRQIAAGRSALIPADQPTHCVNGHPYNEENTAVKKNGHRRCRVCRRANARLHYEPRPAGPTSA